MDDAIIPQDVADLIGQVAVVSDVAGAVEHGAIMDFAAAVEDGNPLYWNAEIAEEITGGIVAPPAMLSSWTRPGRWSPSGMPPQRPLELHFRVKTRFGYPNAVVTGSSTIFLEPARPGDQIRAEQVLAAVGPLVENRLGLGRNWTILVHYRRLDGVLLGTEELTFFGYGTTME